MDSSKFMSNQQNKHLGLSMKLGDMLYLKDFGLIEFKQKRGHTIAVVFHGPESSVVQLIKKRGGVAQRSEHNDGTPSVKP